MRSGCAWQRADLTRSGDELTGSTVHGWLIDLDAPADLDALLSASERDRAASYLRPRDGARFAMSRAWLRMILGRYLETQAADLAFARAPDGRPVLAGRRNGWLHFSLSRAGGRALVALSRAPVGADIERVEARAGLADLVAGRFSGAEAACLADGCGGTPTHGFYRHWTVKEAYLKATGHGLSGLRDTELICAARPAVRFAGQAAPDWQVTLFAPAADCVAAIVGRGPGTRGGPASG